MKRTILAGFALALVTTAACRAQQPSHAYVGAAVGESGFISACQTDASAFDCERRDTAWKLYAGYQFGPHVAVELGYADLGRARASSTGAPPASGTVKARALELDALGLWPVRSDISLYGKLGLFRATARASISGDIPGFLASASTSENIVGVTRGVGVAIALGSRLAVRGELQRYPNVGGGAIAGTNIDVLYFGVIRRFE